MPTPNTPIREQIMASIATRLAAINGPTATYFHTANNVTRSLVPPMRVDEALTLVLYSPGDTPPGQQAGAGAPAGITRKMMQVVVGAWIMREIVSDTHGNEVLHDIEVAVLSDRRQGGFALNSRVDGFTLISSEATAPIAWLEARFVVEYRHRYDDPTIQI